MQTLLVIDDEPNILLCFQRAFRDPNLQLITASSAKEGLEKTKDCTPDVAIIDLCLGDGCGLDVARSIREATSDCLNIVMTAYGTPETAIRATKEGAFDYLLKPLDVNNVREVVGNALRIRRMSKVPAVFEGESTEQPEVDTIVGRSNLMQSVYKAIGRIATRDVNVLILGESGTGKELVARSVYQHSHRSAGQFLAVNCAALPESLLESELFGHERGAFTGADRHRLGKFEQCRGGTLFLDEIGELSLATQAKLLRVLQDGTFQPLGSDRSVHSDVRVLAATNRDLSQLVDSGQFRADLFFRLAEFVIELPPLREREGDLPHLVRKILQQFRSELNVEVEHVPEETLSILSSYPWPGNIRELQNVLRFGALQAAGNMLLPEFLPRYLRQPVPDNATGFGNQNSRLLREWINSLVDSHAGSLYGTVAGEIDEIILDVVSERTGGNLMQMSRILGIARNTLRSKMSALSSKPNQVDDSGAE